MNPDPLMDTSPDRSVDFSSALEELKYLLPKVVHTLIESGHIDTYIKFNELFPNDQMPMRNICYLLFLDLIEWFSVSDRNTSCMRYRFPETLQFWQIGLRIFHGEFIRFMSGTQNQGKILDQTSEKGYFDPACSFINFAVPSQTTLHKSLSNNPQYLPGINLDLIKQVGNHYKGSPMVLGVDGKKISRGKEKTMGDIDCWGCEDKPTLRDRLEIRKDDMDFVDEIIQKCDKIEVHSAMSLENLLETAKYDIIPDLKKLICLIGKTQ